MRKIDFRTATDKEYAAWRAELLAAVADGSLRVEIDAKLDPRWNAEYGDASWDAALAQLGMPLGKPPTP